RRLCYEAAGLPCFPACRPTGSRIFPRDDGYPWRFAHTGATAEGAFRPAANDPGRHDFAHILRRDRTSERHRQELHGSGRCIVTATETIVLQPSRTRHRRPASRTLAFPRAVPVLRVVAILVMQAVLSIRLAHVGIASDDEGLYIYSGHQLIHELWHGGGSPYYETYFSGAPVIYPVLAAMVDHVGGLVLVRQMSGVFILGATWLLYATTRWIFGYWPAVTAAGLFASLGVTQFLSAYATYDAMALMLMAAAAYCAVRAATDHRNRWLLLIPVILLVANATKYASTLFDPVVILLAALMVRDRGWKRVLQRATVLTCTSLVMFAVAVLLAGTTYLKGVLDTTLARSGTAFFQVPAAPHVVALHSWDWIGVI